MPQTEEEFASLMRRLGEGSGEAARELLERYGPHLRRVVRRRLHPKLRSKFDSLDFVQDVWASFFADPQRPRAFDRPETLLAYLVQMTRHKVIETFRQRFRSGKYNLKGEHSFDSAVLTARDLAAREPTPSQLAADRDQWDHFLKRQPGPYRRILVLLHQGMTRAEIARALGLNEKTVRRVLAKFIPGTGP